MLLGIILRLKVQWIKLNLNLCAKSSLINESQLLKPNIYLPSYPEINYVGVLITC